MGELDQTFPVWGGLSVGLTSELCVSGQTFLFIMFPFLPLQAFLLSQAEQNFACFLRA